jgi:hypothetical protein
MFWILGSLIVVIVVGAVLLYKNRKEGYYNYTKDMNNTSGLSFNDHKALRELQARAGIHPTYDPYDYRVPN